MSSPPILGPDEKPARKEEVKNLPLEIENAVRIAVNTAMDGVRVELGKQDRAGTIRGWIKFGISSALAMIAAVVIYFAGPGEIRNWTRQFVDAHMNTPMLREAADNAIKSKMEVYVETKLKPAFERLQVLNDNLNKLETAQKEALRNQEFQSVAQRALLYDANAFVRLTSFANEGSIFSADANRLLNEIKRRLEADRFSYTIAFVKEFAGSRTYTGPYTTDEVAFMFGMLAEPAANLVRERKLHIFLPKLVETFGTETNLWVANRITLAISDLAGQSFCPWTRSELDLWWKEHGGSCTNWPYAEYSEGVNCLNSRKMEDALVHLKAVLKVDPQADKSRAFAVASACEISRIDIATNLLSSFAAPDGRWAQWARAKIELTTGTVERATTMLAAVASNFPTIVNSANMNPQSPFWQKIDWGKYRKLVPEPDR